MPVKVIFCILLYSSFSFACKMGPNSKWNFSERELEIAASNVIIAKLVNITVSKNGLADLKFQIIETKKGKKKKNDIVYIRNVQKTNSDVVSYGKSCNIEFNYKLKHSYLIYVDTLNPKSIIPIDLDQKQL